MEPDYSDLPPINVDEAKPGTLDYDILQWCENKLIAGSRFIESQVGYDKISTTIDAIFSYERKSNASYAPGPRNLSQTQANLIPSLAEDITAMLTDVRYFWNYTTSNAKYEKQARLTNKGAERWYVNRMIDLRIGDVIRYYTLAGTGVAHLYYSRQIDDMMVEAEDPRQVIPINPISYHTFQDCAGVIIRRARTPDWVKDEYHKTVRPESGGGTNSVFGWLQRVIDGPGSRGGPLSKRTMADKEIPHTPTVFVNTMYLRDKRTNKTGNTVKMGPWEDDQPSAPWSYEVRPGAPLYPFHRLIVWANGVLLHDGPSPYWHSMFPVIKFTLNPWPMSWFGKAPLWDCLPLNNSLNANLRVIDDHAAMVAQPGAVADRNVSKSEFAKFNTRMAGYKIKTNMASGKGIVVNNPPPLDPLIWEIIKWCEEKMNKISGVADPSAMSGLNQIPSDDTIDTIMKAMTPGNRLRSRILEGAYKELALMYEFNFWEWDSTSKRVEMFGPEAITNEDFDYRAGVGIPDNVPDGDPGDIAGTESALSSNYPMPMYSRAKAMLKAIVCTFDPSSLLNSAGKQELLELFMLAKMGYVSVFTLWEKMGKMNYLPAGFNLPADEVSRLQLQATLGIGMIANAQGRKATDGAPPSMGETGNGPTIQTS